MTHSMDGKKCKWVSDKEFKIKYLNQIKKAREKQDKRFETFQEIIIKEIYECNISEVDIDKELDANIGKYQRWIDRLKDARDTFVNLELKLKKMDCEIFHYYKFNCDFSTSLKYGSDIKKYVESNECYQALYELLQNQKALLEFIEGTIKNLNNRGFAIKNYIDCKKIDLGIIQ